MRRLFFIFSFIICCYFAAGDCFAQVHIDKEIQFVGPESTRRIEGVVLANDSSSGIPYNSFIETDLNYISSPSGTATLSVSTATPYTAYSAGFELYINSVSANPGALFLNVNGLGPVEVKKTDSSSLVANEILANQVFKVIHNGTHFILLSPSSLKCPAGYVSVNENYCIESIEHPATGYLNAVDYCYSRNARLCTWGEWYYVCQNTSFGAINMQSNYEYVDDTSDHKNTVLVVGRNNCNDYYANLITAANVYTFRCCYSK